jgi:hypothetical protein
MSRDAHERYPMGTKALLAERERLERQLEAAAQPPPPATFGEQFEADEARLRAEIEALSGASRSRPPTKPANVFNPARVEIVWRGAMS